MNVKFYSLVRILGKDDLKYLNQEFHDNVLDPVKQKEIFPYEYRVILKNSQKNDLAKASFIAR